MEDLRKQLIDFMEFAICQDSIPELSTAELIVDAYLKSINSKRKLCRVFAKCDMSLKCEKNCSEFGYLMKCYEK